jgi:hypothetical protein
LFHHPAEPPARTAAYVQHRETFYFDLGIEQLSEERCLVFVVGSDISREQVAGRAITDSLAHPRPVSFHFVASQDVLLTLQANS